MLINAKPTEIKAKPPEAKLCAGDTLCSYISNHSALEL